MKKYNMNNLILISMFFSLLTVNAQSFMPPFEFGNAVTGEITMDDGKTYKGKFTLYGAGLKGVVIKLKTESGDIIKGNRDNMNLIKFATPKSKVGKLMSISTGGKSSLSEVLGQDWKTALNQEYSIFKRMQNKKGKPSFLQLINPGFDDKIQVYLDPKAKETGGSKLTGGLIGGKDKSYYFSKGNSFTTLVEKRKYKKSFTSIYDNCPEMIKNFPDRDFKNIAEHVYFYNKNCDN